MSLAALVVHLNANTRGFDRGMSKGRESMRRFTASVRNQLVGLAAGFAGLQGIKTSLGLAGDAEMAQAQFSVLLKDAGRAKQLLSELQTFAASTPFQIDGLRSATKSLLAFKVPASEVLDTLRRLGDISSLSGKPIGELAVMFGKARANQRLFADDVTRFVEAGIPIYEVLEQKFGVTGAAARKLVESGKADFSILTEAINLATDAGGSMAGGMEIASQTIGGKWSTMVDNLKEQMKQLGVVLIEEFDLKQLVDDVTTFAQQHGPAIVSSIRQIIQTLREWSPVILKVIGVLASLKAAMMLYSAGAAIPALLGAIKVGLMGIVSIPAVAVLTALAAAFGVAYAKSEKFREIVDNITTNTLPSMVEGIEFLRQKMVNSSTLFAELDFLKTPKERWEARIEEMKNSGSKFMAWAAGMEKGIIDAMKVDVEASEIMDGIDAAMKDVDTASPLLDALAAKEADPGGKLSLNDKGDLVFKSSEQFKKEADEVKRIASTVEDFIGGSMAEIRKKEKDALQGRADAIRDSLKSDTDRMREQIAEIQKLKSLGLITGNEATRATGEIAKQFAGEKQQRESGSSFNFSAARAGSTEAFQAIIAAGQGKETAEARAAASDKKREKLLEQIVKVLSEQLTDSKERKEVAVLIEDLR